MSITEKILDACPITDCADFFRVLSDKTRQEIIIFLADHGESCVNDIVASFTLTRPTISHHLNLMKREKLLTSRKEGKEIYFSINKSCMTSFLEVVLKFMKKCS